MKDYSFYKRALKLDKKNAGKYYAERAELYFLDMEYDLAWKDFEKAKKLGFNTEDNYKYDILKFANENNDSDINFEFSEKTTFSEIFRNIRYCIIKNKSADAWNILGNIVKNNFISDFLIAKHIHNEMFNINKNKYKQRISKNPRYQSPYFDRINLYVIHFSEFSPKEKKFYRQRINQDFDTLEKLSKNPEYIYLFRATYFEKQNEIRYAIKFCQKAVDLAKRKNNNGFSYIASSILKDLYVKNYQIDKALDIAMELVETKPSPQVLAKAVNSFHYIPSLFHYKFPKEFEKYKSYKLIVKNMKQKQRLQKTEMNRRIKELQKGYKNGKDNNG